MKKALSHDKSRPGALPKCPTGITGLDEITGGGLPRGRPTLVCGGPGCGKTLLAAEFLYRGATQYDEPGVFVTFEERANELAQNVRSLGFEYEKLVARRKLALEHIHVDRSELVESGEYDLEGLFIRLGHALDSVRARRVVLDTIESLFSGFSNEAILRAELRRLFAWLKDRKVTAVITAESGDRSLTRQGLEEYVSDCVIRLDHRVHDQVSTRRLRVVKYRGSLHGTNEYPFLIEARGLSVLPITSSELNHSVSTKRISTGIRDLDAMLGGKGYYQGSLVLVSGVAGVGKTSLAAHAVNAACGRGERSIYFAFEESPAQLARNMRSIGIDLERWVRSGLLRCHATRPTFYGLETHLATMHRQIMDYAPELVVIDPISSFLGVGSALEARAMLLRLLDFLQGQSITAVMTSLNHGDAAAHSTEVEISSLTDTWILLREIETNGERNRGLYVLKSRGMGHSNQIREFVMTDEGIRLHPVYIGPEGVLTGSSRLSQEAREIAAMRTRDQEIQHKRRELERRRLTLAARIEALRQEFETEQAETLLEIGQNEQREQTARQDRENMARLRGVAPARESNHEGNRRKAARKR